MYAEFTKEDDALTDAISRMSGESSWVDGVWDTAALSQIAAVPIGGKNYKKTSYSHDIPDIRSGICCLSVWAATELRIRVMCM